MLEEMKPLCGLSLEHNPQVGFGWRQGGGRLERNSSTQVLICGQCTLQAAASPSRGHSNLHVWMYACVSVDLAHLAWPGICPLSSSHRVGVGALCERLPVCGQPLLWRGRGERRPPSQQPPPSQRTQGAYRNVRGGWPWQRTSPVQWSQEAQVGHAPVMMSCLFTGLNDGKETCGNVTLGSALQTSHSLFWAIIIIIIITSGSRNQ